MNEESGRTNASIHFALECGSMAGQVGCGLNGHSQDRSASSERIARDRWLTRAEMQQQRNLPRNSPESGYDF